jgi:hypothetical protein
LIVSVLAAPVALAVELEEEDALPTAERQLAVAHGDRLAGRPEEHRHAVRVAVSDLHVLLADVLRAPVPVVVRVVVVARHEPPEQRGEVLEEAVLELVHANAGGRVRRVHAGDPVDDARLAHRVRDVVGDVAHREPTGRPQLALVVEDLHAPRLCPSPRRYRAGTWATLTSPGP